MNKKYEIIAKIDSVNQGAHFCNITVMSDMDEVINIKLKHDQLQLIEIGKAYLFQVKEVIKSDDKINIEYISSELIEDALSDEQLDTLLPKFYEYAPLSPKTIRDGIEGYLNAIDNNVYKTITKEIYEKNKHQFYLHPAATKFHHAYVGGLSFHTLTMLKMIDTFVELYPYLNKDLLYAGGILHDMQKIDEMTGADGEYTTEGKLIGHLVMGTIDIDTVARKHGFIDSEEVLLLKHMILAHHGQLNFGSPKKPQIGEALLLWFLDTIDSKLATLGDVYNETLEGTFTQMVPVLDRMRFYKAKKTK